MVSMVHPVPSDAPHESPPERLAYPPAVEAALYSPAELRERFVFLRRDYCRVVAGTSHLPNEQRFALVRQRLGDYSTALAGRRQIGGRR